MASMAPTTVASSPMQRWRKPPSWAFAYIAPARSSKRRMSIIRSRIRREVSASGSECSEPTSSGGRRSTARWGSPLPSPDLTWASADFARASADLAWASATFAFSLSSTSIGPEVTPSSERVRAEKRAMRASTNRLTARRGAHRLRMTVRIVSRMLASRADGGHCPVPYGPWPGKAGQFREAMSLVQPFDGVRAPGNAVADRQGRQLADAELDRARGGGIQRPRDRGALDPLEHRARVELTRRRGDQDVVDHAQVAARGERLPHRGERERHAAAGLLRVSGGERRHARVERERVRPADRR